MARLTARCVLDNRSLDLSIESDENGAYRISYATKTGELIPPNLHELRMEWIRNSFESFFQRVRELDDGRV